jgi:hypothetical protein
VLKSLEGVSTGLKVSGIHLGLLGWGGPAGRQFVRGVWLTIQLSVSSVSLSVSALGPGQAQRQQV